MKIIAIDGPSGVGKSTIAKNLSKKFNLVYLDTGKMYRAFAYHCLCKGINLKNEKEVEKNLKNYKDIFPQIPEKILLSEEIGRSASIVAQYNKVRNHMVNLQREFGLNKGCIVEGRDTTTVLFPKTPFKFFLNAKLEIRIWRRYKQIKKNWAHIAKEIGERDKRDRERKIAPLKISKDAIPIDTSYLNIKEVTNLITKILKEIGFY